MKLSELSETIDEGTYFRKNRGYYALELPKPQSYVEFYDDAIEMLSVTEEDEIELDQEMFKKLWSDKWSWKEDFRQMFNTYSVTI